MNKQRTSWLRIFLLCVLLTCSFLTKAAIIYVNPAAAGANNGTSWANAYTSLSAALLASASGDEIWVKAGVYKPTTSVDVNGAGGAEAREVTFQIPSGVALYGGFAGSELTRDERNWETNLTILSGDIDNNDINLDGNSIAEVVTNIAGNNAYHVIYTLNVSEATILDGFIVTAGRANGGAGLEDINRDGSGWYNKLSAPTNASSPTIVNTTFQGNHSLSDGGAINHTAGPAGAVVLSTIENCKFINNKTDVNGGAIRFGSFSAGNYQLHIISSEFVGNEAIRKGGALYFVGDHSTIDSTTFTSNFVTVVSPDGSTLPGAGGAATLVASNAIFNNSIFKSNSTTGNPTGFFEGGGGGAVHMSANEPQTVSLGVSAPKFVSCGFYNNVASGNTAAWGGATVQLSDGGKLRPSYVNCVFAGNQAQNNGGALASFTRVLSLLDPLFQPDLTLTITNCTFSGNNAANGGGLYLFGYEELDGDQLSQVTIVNTIVWGNTATTNPGITSASESNNQISYSLIQGSGGSGGGWNAAIGTDGGNNKDTNPGFSSAADADGPDNIPATNDDGLTLIASSAAVDAGNNGAPGLVGITTDYRLGNRVLGAKVDMGAYERAGIIIPNFPIRWLYDWKPFPPVCLSCPWSFLLLDQTLQAYIWDGPAQLVETAEYSYVKGHIVNPKNKKQGFDVYLKLINKHDWQAWSAKGRTYTAFSLEAITAAKKSHTRWTFWELSDESYLKGTVDFSGTLKLTHLPTKMKTGFQLGTGANGWDKDPGLGGSFYYKGTIVQKGKKRKLSGAGSMNVDAILCEKDCVPFEESQRLIAEVSEEVETPPFLSREIAVYPVPARTQLTVLSDNLDAGKYAVKFYNNKGTLKRQGTLDTETGNLTLDVNDLEQGIYILKMTSPSGETLTKKLVIE